MHHVLTLLASTMPGMPATSGLLAALVLLLLALAAASDARTARVPDHLIALGFLVTISGQGYFVDWRFAGNHFLIAFAVGFSLYFINDVWFRLAKRDAIGMGDAKWTALAVAAFGPLPALIAWFVGAWLALIWMGLMRARCRPVGRVFFAPFLFFGLLTGIYWLRLR